MPNLHTMRRLLSLLFISVIILFASITPAFAQTSVTGKIIILDPGHGGTDSGAVNGNLREADVTLDIAKNYLKPMLEADGAVVYLTRGCDCTKTNEDRYTFANNNHGDVLLSIHLNGSTNPLKEGTQGLYGQKNKDEAFTRVIHQALYPALSVPDLGVTNFASGVLLKSNMPATIAETVFITNSNEYNLLTNGTGNRQRQIAQNLYQGLTNWFATTQTPSKGKKP